VFVKKQLLGFLTVSLFSSAAMAQGGYIGIDLGTIDAELSADGFSETYRAEPTALRVRGGGLFSKHFALEGYIGLGLADDEIGGTGLDFELTQLIGANAVGIIPLGNVFSLYGKLGIASVEFEDGDGDKYDDMGLTYGFGVKFNTGSVGAVVIEYAVLPDAVNDEYGIDLNVESEMLSIGYEFNL
jgi:hypothetical protein